MDESIASFVLPLGMTINMDGTAIMQVIATVFIAGCAGYTVTPASWSWSPAGPAGICGHPRRSRRWCCHPVHHLVRHGLRQRRRSAGYSLILAINRPIEMLVTSLNVVGDAVASICVAKSEGLLNEETFNK